MRHEMIADIVLNHWENKSLYGWEVSTVGEPIFSNAVTPVPESAALLKENVFYTTRTQEDPVITFFKWLLFEVIAFIFCKIFFGKKSTYVAVNRKPKNRYRRFKNRVTLIGAGYSGFLMNNPGSM